MKSLIVYKIDNWDAASYFELYRGAEDEGAKEGIFVPSFWSYHQCIPVDSHGYGFVCDDPFKNPYSILPGRYIGTLPDMDGLLFRAFAQEGVLPKGAKPMLDDANASGYRFMRMAVQKFHPDFVHDATTLCGDFPHMKIYRTNF